MLNVSYYIIIYDTEHKLREKHITYIVTKNYDMN